MLRSRLGRVTALEFVSQLRRPLFIVLLVLVVASTWGVSRGNLRISSGDATVGGKQAWITSEYANTLLFCYLTLLFYAFFVAVAAGTTVVQDEDLRTGEIVHTTGLRPREYIWGKFWGTTGAFLAILIVQGLVAMLCENVLPVDDADKIRGPFSAWNILKPLVAFATPTIVFLSGVSFALGEKARRPIAVFLFPVAIMLTCVFFFWDWSPTWLDPRLNAVLQWMDPTGFRWLNETHIKVDRGVDFYNTQPVAWDWPFALSRIAFVAAALGAVALTVRRFAHRLRGKFAERTARSLAAPARSAPAAAAVPAPLHVLQMNAEARGFFWQALRVGRFELRNLAASAGLYLFVPLIVVQAILTAVFQDGAWGTRLLVTSGNFAVASFHSLTLCTVLLLLFYTVESLDREQGCRLAPIYSTTAVRTAAVFLGKSLANCFVGAVILAGAWIGCALTILVQHRAALEGFPFFVVWGWVLTPTLFFWTAFVLALQSLTRNKYTTYAIALSALVGTGLLQTRGKMNWVWNWDAWGTLRWTDFGVLEPNLQPLLVNRLLVTSAGVFFLVLAARWSARREFDATRLLHRLAPQRLLRSSLPLVPWAVVPLTAAIVLAVQVRGSFQSKPAQRAERDYWRQNLATWNRAPQPGLAGAELQVSLDPAQRRFHTRGTYRLRHNETEPLQQFALTVGRHAGDVTWTLQGAPYKPDNRSRLFVFTPPAPFAAGDTLAVGFDFAGRFPPSITKNGLGMMEFILPAGVVLTGFRPTFAPTIGWDETIGVDPKENRYEPRRYPDDYWESRVRPSWGLDRPFPVRMVLDAPEAYQLNGVGTLIEEHVENGRRFATWESDEPVTLFNIIAGRWDVRHGEGTAIYHHPKHTYNLDEMIRTLDGARRWYSEWFAPYPWQDLKLSEFADLSAYAQGFGTNITFSEGIGFTTWSDTHTRAAFLVTAHEAAHQWWGNMLVPGDGPGGDILSEGMAHFSTILLADQLLGPQGRIEFARRIEERYGDARRVDAERPLVKIDGSREGDTSVTYDKGGWVAWMLLNQMGRESMLAGLRAFIANHRDNPDHPLLEDLVAELRPFAADTTGFDAFTRQWFFEVHIPEYRFEDVQREPAGAGFRVRGVLYNAGTGRMSVDIAAVHGDRFVKQTAAEAAAGPAAVSDEYRDARATVEIGPGERVPFVIDCDFEPDQVLADPDARVLQLKRKFALQRFGPV